MLTSVFIGPPGGQVQSHSNLGVAWTEFQNQLRSPVATTSPPGMSLDTELRENKIVCSGNQPATGFTYKTGLREWCLCILSELKKSCNTMILTLFLEPEEQQGHSKYWLPYNSMYEVTSFNLNHHSSEKFKSRTIQQIFWMSTNFIALF
jgi:hypothetical protein